MSKSRLPQRASLEYLKKLAKDRLKELRRADPRAKLAEALLVVAREHGFSSWRTLKAEVEKRQEKSVVRFIEACFYGDVDKVRALIARDPSLVRAFSAHKAHHIRTGLHVAAMAGHLNVVRLLLENGADPNAREAGDNTYPLHWAAASGNIEIVRALLDAGGDVHGVGDAHDGGVIGWATNENEHRAEVVSLLVERGARHHIFSAINLGDLQLIEKVVEEDPAALDRRMSRFERGQTPLHAAINRKRYDILDLLIDIGADVEAKDMGGQTAMELAMLRSDQEAIGRLEGAGAKAPERVDTSSFRERVAKLAESTRKGVPSIAVPDIAATLDWYTSIGFKELGRFEDDGVVSWGWLAFGKAEFMLGMMGKPGEKSTSLWFYVEKVDELYQLFKARKLESMKAGQPGIEFEEDIYDPFYGGRQFSIRDLNGYGLIFYQE
ncbi:MAG TPA: ankyrin repeat domain-containing protein [Thermoanaerobaculia bacterium]|nr:ankyrin repeat domain-containing protein [Thermoanaerobaculia bacterium]